MIILGLDPGLATTGFGVISVNELRQMTCLTYGVISTKAKTPLEDRLLVIREDLKDLIQRHKPAVCAIERLFFNTNVTTALPVAHARGVLLLTLAEANIAIYEYTPLQVKSRLVGYGMAEKQQVQAMVKRSLNLAKIPRPDDAADGLAIAICHYFAKKRRGLD